MSDRRVDTITLASRARDAERAYREYGLGRCPTNAMLAAREAFENEASPEVVLDLIEVYETAEDVAGALELAVSRSEQLEAQLTAFGIPVNELVAALKNREARSAA